MSDIADFGLRNEEGGEVNTGHWMADEVAELLRSNEELETVMAQIADDVGQSPHDEDLDDIRANLRAAQMADPPAWAVAQAEALGLHRPIDRAGMCPLADNLCEYGRLCQLFAQGRGEGSCVLK